MTNRIVLPGRPDLRMGVPLRLPITRLLPRTATVVGLRQPGHPITFVEQGLVATFTDSGFKLMNPRFVARDPRAVPALMALLHDDFYSIRREAAAALVAIGAPAMGAVISALGDRDGDVRKRAADVLAEIGDARAIEPLRGIFSDEDWYVRKAAEGAVEKIRGRTGESR